MPLFKLLPYSKEKCTVAIWQITESEEELMAPLCDGEVLLEEARRRFKAPSRRLEWLSVRRLKHELGVTSPIAYLPSGRPYLKDDAHHFSISHTRGYAAVAISELNPIGLDIEQRTDKVCRVRDKCLSREEKTFPLLAKKNVEAMIVVWTIKEAMFKLMDNTGIDFAEHFHVSPFELADEGCLQAHETLTEEQKSFQFTYQIYPDFILSLGLSQG